MASTAPNRPEPLPRAGFVRSVRRVASSVAVVSTDGSAGCHGAAVSAFPSMSVDPPVILDCLLSGSRIATAVEANGGYLDGSYHWVGPQVIPAEIAGHSAGSSTP